jgi:hypothetical protein
MLAEPGRTWHMLMSEAALRWTLGSSAVMHAQLEHLIAVSRLPTMRLGVVGLSAPKTMAPPAAFHMYDRVVSVATEVGTSFVTEPSDVDHFERLFDRLDHAATYGDDARALISRIAAEHAGGT